MSALRTDGIDSGYKGIKIIEDVSIEAEELKITCIIGPNGAGKSTVLKTIYGFLKPWKGKVFIGSKEITRNEPYRMLKDGIAFMLQRQSAFPRLTIKENLEMGAWTIRQDVHAVENKIEELYDKFPTLQAKRNDKAQTLSGGQRRMLELARVLMTDPKVLILDEPSAGLAPIVISELYDKLKELREKMTILIVDQNVRRAVEIVDYVYVLEKGKKTFESPGGSLVGGLKEHIRSWLQFD